MATIKEDTFTEASDTPLENHTSDSGGGWGQQASQFDIVGATDIVQRDAGGTRYASGDEAPSENDHKCSVNGKTNGTASSDRVGATGRFSASGARDGYFGYVLGTGATQILKITANSSSSLGSGSISGFSASTSYDIRLEVVGSDLELFIDGVSNISGVSDTAHASGEIGFVITGTNAEITSLLAEDFVDGGPVFIPKIWISKHIMSYLFFGIVASWISKDPTLTRRDLINPFKWFGLGGKDD